MIRATIAFLASVLTAVQAFSIYIQGQALCFNNGCAIVDSLTTVSPLFFNIAGFLFFQILILWTSLALPASPSSPQKLLALRKQGGWHHLAGG